MKKIRNYPRLDGGQYRYVKYPIQITESILLSAKEQKLPVGKKMKIGQWMAVDVLEEGYRINPFAITTDSEDYCQKGCDIHNKYHGWTLKQVIKIIDISMNNSLSK
ncbi:hypothetical protein [Dyadobacter sp. CY312]|uniref:hypothetical protein n=1 Tax=Dyadobacter sp. CY312 TaxID=2907303 RepID=UPI001F185662|nr:hypothetical protein [Dyadobacter sp. CY312]MCE7039168.1 hypothetical protein [Dyadobacter sp. CY312]